MPKVSAYEASILVNGVALREYDTGDSDNETKKNTVVKYVEATEGTEFHVKVSIDPYANFPTGIKSIQITVDGTFADNYFLDESKDGNRYTGWSRVRKGRDFLEDGSWVYRTLTFKNPTTTEEVKLLATMKEITKDVGCIRMDITDVTCTDAEPWTEKPLETQAIPEKALKGQPIDMSAGYGAGAIGAKARFYHTKKVGNTLATIIVKYRSRHALQMLELIPETPERQPLAQRDINTLNPQEMRQLLTEMRKQGEEMADQLAKVKQQAVEVKEESDFSLRPRKSRSATVAHDNDDDCMIVEVKRRKVVKKEVDVLDLT